ncbi:MAG: protein-tyrosine phosphatase family protein [Terracidiphilus sp.]
MLTQLYWIDGPWKGKLAISARPRGGDWLEDEISTWRDAGVDLLVSQLTREEEVELRLEGEKELALQCGMDFLSFPVPDREAPASFTEALAVYGRIGKALSDGRKAVVHCRQGIGRAALTAVSLLILKGISTDEALRIVGHARGVSVPETAGQRRWIDDFAARLIGASAA